FTEAVHSLTGSTTILVGNIRYLGVGFNIVLLLAAVVALLLRVISYPQSDARRGVPLLADLTSALRGEDFRPVPGQPAADAQAPEPVRRGLLLALEGGEGAGKSTQARLLAIWLRDQGFDVVATHEPGATKIGMRLRALLLDTAHTGMDARAEALLYAADRAEHVQSLILPALERGAVVVTDRYIDSSLAYQGTGRQVQVADIAEVNRWATGGLMPARTIVLDLPPLEGLGRRVSSADRLESEPLDFH